MNHSVRRTTRSLCAFIAVGAVAPSAEAQYTWSGGQYDAADVSPSAPSTLLSGDTLAIHGSGLYFSGGGGLTTHAGSTVTWTSGAIGFSNGAAVSNSGLWNADSSAGFSMYDDGYGGSFTDNTGGTLRNSGSGALTINAAGSFSFQNSGGTIDGGTGSIEFASGIFGQVQFATGSAFSGQVVIGGDGAQFTGSQTFSAGSKVQFSSGYFYNDSSTTAVTVNGNATWTGGSFYDGSWSLPTGYTLTADTTPGGNTKFFDGTSFTNDGTIQWTTADPVLLQNGTSLTNNGSFIASAATTLADGGYGGTFVNAGIFENNGAGTVTVIPAGSFDFQNNAGGIIQTENASDSIVFTSGNYQQATFANNTHFNGPGTISIEGDGATFTGSQNIAGNTHFVLAAGYYVPGTGGASLSGLVNWTGGQFYSGAWNLAAGSQLNVATTTDGSAKYFEATTFTNYGTVNWATTDPISLAAGAALVNTGTGTFNISKDTSFADGGYGGTVVNNGLLSKTGGTGTTSVAQAGSFAGLVNNGVTQVLSGTIALGTAFSNPGTLAGTTTFSAGTLTNTGHVSPGAYGGAPGSLALTGNYVQTAAGFFDVGLTGSSNSIFNVSGTAHLAGTVDVTCVGSCSYGAGTQLEILSSTGLSGNFTSIDEYGFSPSTVFALLQRGGDEYLVIGASGAAPVPVPATAWLMLSGLGAMGLSMRRRHGGAVKSRS